MGADPLGLEKREEHEMNDTARMIFYIHELESARSPGWFQVDCEICGWYTTGWESVCEEAGWSHLKDIHPRRNEKA